MKHRVLSIVAIVQAVVIPIGIWVKAHPDVNSWADMFAFAHVWEWGLLALSAFAGWALKNWKDASAADNGAAAPRGPRRVRR